MEKTSQVVVAEGETLSEVKDLRSIKAQIRALEEKAKTMQQSLYKAFGVDPKSETVRQLAIVDGNGKPVGTIKTAFRDGFEVKPCYVTRLTIQRTFGKGKA